MKIINKNIIEAANQEEFDVIVHGCNCFCVQGGGVAFYMNKEFNTLSFEMEKDVYKGDINKLGTIDYEYLSYEDDRWVKYPDENGRWVTKRLVVVNAYTQYNYGTDSIKLDYSALRLCFKKINKLFPNSVIGMPKIGCGLAGGDWEVVERIINQDLTDCTVKVYEI